MKRVITLLAVVALMATTITETQADFVSGFTGNTRFDQGATTGWVNFAVYNNDGASHAGTGNWITELGLGGLISDPLVTGLERNVFFYQIVAEASGLSGTVFSITLPTSDPWVSAGVLTGGTVFNESGSGAVDNTNFALGTDSTSPGTPSVDGVLNGTNPFISGITVNAPTVAVPSTATIGGFASGFLADDETSPVFFLTSNSQPVTPVFGGANLSAGGTPLLPASNPEPGSLVLLSMGMAGVVYRRRKKKLELLEEKSTEIDA